MTTETRQYVEPGEPEPAVPLLGGDVTEGLVRVGDTVRRPVSDVSQRVRMQPSGRDFVIAATLSDPVCAAVLERMPALGLSEWWLTAGAVFQNVWNALSGMPPGTGIKDYDVFYFENSDLSWEAEDRIIREAAELFADVGATIEIRNEARVHLWYESRFGKCISPFTSARDAIDSFAAAACCVALTREGQLVELYAPFGLDDTIAMHLKPNRRMAPRSVYETKVNQYRARWPRLTAEPWEPGPRSGQSG